MRTRVEFKIDFSAHDWRKANENYVEITMGKVTFPYFLAYKIHVLFIFS